MPEKNKIPKIIHYCWFGRNPKTELINKCIRSWKKYLPDYKIREWNDEDLINCKNSYVQGAYKAKKYAFVSDWYRLYALYNYGGIYFDSDNEVFKSFDNLLNLDFFSGFEVYNGKPLPFTAVVGACQNQKIIRSLLKEYDSDEFLDTSGKMNLKTNTQRVTKYFKDTYNLTPPYNPEKKIILDENCILFPHNYFCTYEKNISYAVHHFNGSWKTKNQESFLQKIFSVRNSYSKKGKHKVITILGIKFKFKLNK